VSVEPANQGPFDDVTWVTNLVGNNMHASLEGVNFRDVTDWTFDQYFEVIQTALRPPILISG